MFQQQQTVWLDSSCEVSCLAKKALGALRADLRNNAPEDALEGQRGLRSREVGSISANVSLSTTAEWHDRLHEAALALDQTGIDAVVQDMLAAGFSSHEIKAHFVPLIARRLGDDWVRDAATFGAVTIGCARLQSLVRRLPSIPVGGAPVTNGRASSCLVVVPKGQHHTLGAVVLTEEVRHAGVDAQLSIGATPAEVTRLVRSHDFAAVMISAALGESIADLTDLVRAVRASDTQAKVLIGGGLLGHRSDLCALTGADYVTNNAQEALDLFSLGCCVTRSAVACQTTGGLQPGSERRAFSE